MVKNPEEGARSYRGDVARVRAGLFTAVAPDGV